MSSRYTLHGGPLSLFTRKLEAALQFYGADFEPAPPNPDVAKRADTHQVPVLVTPENWAIADTTPLMELLDGRFPERRMFPAGPLGVLVHVIEEHLDEWTARVMVHWRWHYPDSAAHAARIISETGGGDAETIQKWGPRACRATGTESVHQRKMAEEEYERLLGAAESQLGETRYLLGDRPTAVDCMFLGGLRAHTYHDPDPKKVVAKYKRVVSWCEESADPWEGQGELAPFPESTSFARHVLSEMPSTYKPFVLGSVAASAAGQKAFEAESYGERVSYLTRPYPGFSRLMVRDRVQRLPEAERRQALEWLTRVDVAECFV